MKFQSELELARVIRAKDLSESLRPELPVRQVKIWAVQQVERFSAEFQVQPLGNRSEFCQPQIEGSISGTSNNASGGISELAKRLELERIHIEPFVRSLGPVLGSPVRLGRSLNAPVSLCSP